LSSVSSDVVNTIYTAAVSTPFFPAYLSHRRDPRSSPRSAGARNRLDRPLSGVTYTSSPPERAPEHLQSCFPLHLTSVAATAQTDRPTDRPKLPSAKCQLPTRPTNDLSFVSLPLPQPFHCRTDLRTAEPDEQDQEASGLRSTSKRPANLASHLSKCPVDSGRVRRRRGSWCYCT
jgi:hypothetical protein